jgi:hypothetical protein
VGGCYEYKIAVGIKKLKVIIYVLLFFTFIWFFNAFCLETLYCATPDDVPYVVPRDPECNTEEYRRLLARYRELEAAANKDKLVQEEHLNFLYQQIYLLEHPKFVRPDPYDEAVCFRCIKLIFFLLFFLITWIFLIFVKRKAPKLVRY